MSLAAWVCGDQRRCVPLDLLGLTHVRAGKRAIRGLRGVCAADATGAASRPFAIVATLPLCPCELERASPEFYIINLNGLRLAVHDHDVRRAT